ncbi:TetR/AcrR family transcriptional regulator [Oleomonas cavernae]|nr:TetR/AcrR family transcriptional regulator [Oleomonas cavernae]
MIRAIEKTRRAPQLQPSERREQLMDCALAVFAERGIGGARHARIAQVAGVATPTVFTYFPTRDDLVASVLAEVHRRTVGMLRERAATAATARGKLEAILAAVVEFAAAGPDVLKVYLDWTTSSDGAVRTQFLTSLEETLDVFRAIVRAGAGGGEFKPSIDVEDAAHFIFGACHMIAQMNFLGSPRHRIRMFAATMAEAVFAMGA